MQHGKIRLLLALAFLLGLVTAGLLFGLSGEAGTHRALVAAAGAGLFGLGLGIGGLYVGVVAVRRDSRHRPAPRHTAATAPTVGEALPTVTDYYRNAADGEPLRRTGYPGRRLPDAHWMEESAGAGDRGDHGDHADA